MLKNKCLVWKRIKFPTFCYNCYYFTWSDTYFIQLETLLINHPSYYIIAQHNGMAPIKKHGNLFGHQQICKSCTKQDSLRTTMPSTQVRQPEFVLVIIIHRDCTYSCVITNFQLFLTLP